MTRNHAPRVVLRAGGIMRPGTLLKTDKCTIAVERAPQGKIRVRVSTWAER
jgi:hypothetical protein